MALVGREADLYNLGKDSLGHHTPKRKLPCLDTHGQIAQIFHLSKVVRFTTYSVEGDGIIKHFWCAG